MKKTIAVGEVKDLLSRGKTVKVKTIGDVYAPIIGFIEKGILDTYKVFLDNGMEIKVSKEHRFFTNVGWLEAKDIIPDKTTILCEDNKYHVIKSVNYIGKYRIVDVTVEHPEHCYFGNGILNHNTGKSLICAQMIAETQRRGGLAVFFDSEFAVDKTFWTALGIDVRNVNYVPFTTLEELFTKMELCIGAFRKVNKDRLLTIFVDSLTQASVESEMESEHGVDGFSTGKAKVIAKAMRKITGLVARQRILTVFTNQLRYNMNGGLHSEKWITPGGKAFSYSCSIRVRFVSLGKLKKGDEIIGMKCQAQVIKNRLGPNWRTAAFEIHYDSGIQNYKSWIDFMKLYGIITGDWRNWKYTRPSTGEKIEFSTAEFVDKLNSDEALKEEIYNSISDTYIMQYRDPSANPIVEDVEETGNENDDITKNAVKEE